MKYWKNTEDKNLKGEIWKTIDGFSKYQVSSYGRVRCIKRSRGSHYREWEYPIILKQKLCKKGYCVIGIVGDNGKKKSRRVHRLVGSCFIKNPNNLPQINHINGDKELNTIENLEWISNTENMRHSYKIGLRVESSKGEKNGRSLLKEEDIIYIYNNPDRKNIAELAKKYDVDKSTITSIYSGKNWGYLTKNLKMNKISKRDRFIKCYNAIEEKYYYVKSFTDAKSISNISINRIYRFIEKNQEKDGWLFEKCSYDEYINNKEGE